MYGIISNDAEFTARKVWHHMDESGGGNFQSFQAKTEQHIPAIITEKTPFMRSSNHKGSETVKIAQGMPTQGGISGKVNFTIHKCSRRDRGIHSSLDTSCSDH